MTGATEDRAWEIALTVRSIQSFDQVSEVKENGEISFVIPRKSKVVGAGRN